MQHDRKNMTWSAVEPFGPLIEVHRKVCSGTVGTGKGMTVPERAVGDCHPRQTVWLRADGPRSATLRRTVA